MELITYSDMYDKAVRELDLQNELFLQTDEILGYMNEAIKNAETAIHSLSDELAAAYFQVPGNLTLVAGQQDYAFPSDIYATKLKKIFYNNGSRKYEITKFRQLGDLMYVQSGDDYRYIPINFTQENGGWKYRIQPTPQEAGVLGTIWYVREMRKLTNSTTDVKNVCEIPECQNFISQHIRWNVSKKTRRQDLVAGELADRNVQFELMCNTLKEMIPDANNKMLMDVTSYLDQETDLYNG